MSFIVFVEGLHKVGTDYWRHAPLINLLEWALEPLECQTVGLSANGSPGLPKPFQRVLEPRPAGFSQPRTPPLRRWLSPIVPPTNFKFTGCRHPARLFHHSHRARGFP